MKQYQTSWKEAQEDAREWTELWFVPGSVLTQKISPSPLSVDGKLAYGKASIIFKWMPIPFQSSDSILATIYWLWSHLFYMSR